LKSKSFLLPFFKKEDSFFFFEKKKQKTFIPGSIWAWGVPAVVTVGSSSLDLCRRVGHFGFMRRLVFLILLVASPASAMLPGMEGDRTFFLPQVAQEAATYGVPAEVADAVAMVETGYRPDAIGSSGEIGIMQILPSTAVQLGFHGTRTELLEPAINIHLAVQYLARAWQMSGGDICRALMKYRAGLGEELMSPLSAQYCTRAIAWLKGVGSRYVPEGGAPESAQPGVAADPYVITIGPAMPGNVQQMLAAQTPMQQQAPPPRHRRSMAERAAALQASFDSHMRTVDGHATTTFEPGD